MSTDDHTTYGARGTTIGTTGSVDRSRGEAAGDVSTADVVLDVDGLTFGYADQPAIADCSLSVREGEVMTLLGPSGCGKTTTLRCIAGLERPDVGTVRVGSDVVAEAESGTFVPPEDRDVGLVFQQFALFPHLTAAENVAFGIDHWPAEERRARVQGLLERVGLTDREDSRPDELSGGQQQRIALARAMAPRPDVLLLDEPFSNLDRSLRVETRERVRKIIKEAGVTALFVTHDQEEALSISDRVAVMNDGRIEQVGHPEAVFQQPASRFVADFLGQASFVRAEVDDDVLRTPIGDVDRDRAEVTGESGDAIDLLVRPDDVIARPASRADANGEVVYRRYLGPSVLYRIEFDSGETIECLHNHAERVDLGDPVSVRLTADHDLAWFPREAPKPESDDRSPD